MQEELIMDAAMQHHTLNEYINYWVRVSTKALAEGDCNLQNSAAAIINSLSRATFALGEVFDKKEEVK